MDKPIYVQGTSFAVSRASVKHDYTAGLPWPDLLNRSIIFRHPSRAC
jgi:hypothetical protein